MTDQDRFWLEQSQKKNQAKKKTPFKTYLLQIIYLIEYIVYEKKLFYFLICFWFYIRPGLRKSSAVHTTHVIVLFVGSCRISAELRATKAGFVIKRAKRFATCCLQRLVHVVQILGHTCTCVLRARWDTPWHRFSTF